MYKACMVLKLRQSFEKSCSVPGTAVIERVDECERKGSSNTTRQDVLAELLILRSVLGGLEHGLNGVLESEVQGLGGEVTDDVGHVT